MTPRESMPFPFRWYESLLCLPDAELRKMLKAISDYAAEGTTPDFSGAMLALWAEYRDRINKDRNAYYKTCKKNSENIKKRWNRIQPNTTEQNGIPPFTKNTEGDNMNIIQKKRGTKVPPKEKVSFAGFLPSHLQCPSVIAKWQEWEDYRRSKNKPISKAAAIKQFAMLAQEDITSVLMIIDESIRNDWQGLFPYHKLEQQRLIPQQKDLNGI